MFEITEAEIRRNSYEKAFLGGYQLFMRDLFPKKNIQCVDGKGKMKSKIYYGRCLDNDKLINVYVEVDEKNRISSYYCGCPDVGHYIGGMCSHLTCLCFSILSYFQGQKIVLSQDDKKRIFEELKAIEDNRKLKSLEFKHHEEYEKNNIQFDNLLRKYDIEKDEIVPIKKVQIVPLIYLDKVHYLSLKVGIDKLYVIKNINGFLTQVFNNEFCSYGKKLSFNHNIESFDETSQSLLKMLMSSNRYLQRETQTYTTRDLIINDVMLEEILSIYQGKNILLFIGDKEDIQYDYQKVTIMKRPYRFEIILDEKGILHFKDEKILKKIIKGFRKKYVLIDDKIYELDEVDSDLEPVVDYLIQYNQLDVNDVLEKFLGSLYPRIFESIEVDENFQKEHPMKHIKIESYFDFVDGIVELTTKYYLNDELVDENNLMNEHFNVFKLERYNNCLKKMGFEEQENRFVLSNTQKIVDFLRLDLSNLKRYGDVFLSSNLKKTSIQRMNRGTVSIKYDVDMLSICFDDFGFNDDELYKLLNGYKNKKKFVKLNKDTIVEIDNEMLEEISNLTQTLNLDEKHLLSPKKVPLYQALNIDYESKKAYQLDFDNQILGIISNIKEFKDRQYPLPPSMKDSMRPYQVEAFNWLKILTECKFGGVLADDMGLGKTLEMISLLASDEKNMPSLIVCPKSLMYNWLNELNKWHSNLEGVIVFGPINERKKIISEIDNSKKIYITSYDSLRNDVDMYEKKDFRFIILDEGQFIKNTSALKTKAVKILKGEVKFALTGTPIENSLSDLWSIFDFILPGYLSSYNSFKEKYEMKIVLEDDKEMLDLLIKKVTPFILRRTKKDVLTDLPEKSETIHYAFMGEEQRKTYESYLLKVRDDIASLTSKVQILSSLTRLRQLCVDPNLFIDNYTGGSCKVEMALELIDEMIDEGHRILLFSQFKSIFPKIIEGLEQKNIKYFVITGDTSSEDRVRCVDDFNKNEVVKVFLISLKAGGTGLNLVGADTVIHFDPWWNVSAENQATDRAHRIGQIRNVEVIKLICANTIEQKVLELQNVKKELTEKVIADNDENIIKLDKSDLKYLLS